ncbi:transposase [Pandoraea faecigallinarum]|uniref:Transposase n=2 Tax=Pandoraea TaxID=93217 RepID=A0A5E4YW69_9BURK|nr:MULTISPECIES: transposase [Pandoraea]AKM31308.1 transposase [Pandoraea faecigallinarum]VVE53141.1 transposase [Pandoraea fibrosis]
MKKRYTDEQIIDILRETRGCQTTAELCLKYGISEATYYNWRTKFGEKRQEIELRLKALEKENNELRKLLALSLLDNVALRDKLARE